MTGIRLALVGDAAFLRTAARPIAYQYGLRDIDVGDLPWPDQPATRHRVTVRHLAVRLVCARMIIAGESGYLLHGLPAQPACIRAILDRADHLGLSPDAVIALGVPPGAATLFDGRIRAVHVVKADLTALAALVSHLLRDYREEALRSPSRIRHETGDIPPARDHRRLARTIDLRTR